MLNSAKVFLTDALLRKSLTAMRCLGRRGIRVGTGDDCYFTLAGFSRFCCESVVYPSPQRSPRVFAEYLANYLIKHDYDLLLPMDDATMMAVHENRGLFPESMLHLLPDLEKFRQVGDKASIMRLAARQGINHPRTWQMNDFGQLDQIADEVRFPVLVRPRISSGSRGMALAENQAGLAEAYRRVARQYPDPIIQEYIPQGDKYDVCLLYDKDSRVVASFVQKELRHFPLEWGPSTMQESVCMPALVEQAEQLLAPVGWQGIAEVEFMYKGTAGPAAGSQTAEMPYLMEVNPRFWNSLFLATACGVDFPWLWLQLSQQDHIKPCDQYIIGRRSRWFWPGDVLHALAMLGRGRRTAEFFHFRDPNIFDDTWDHDDRRPLLGLMMVTLCSLFDPHMWKMMFFRRA